MKKSPVIQFSSPVIFENHRDKFSHRDFQNHR
eukprot:UN10144